MAFTAGSPSAQAVTLEENVYASHFPHPLLLVCCAGYLCIPYRRLVRNRSVRVLYDERIAICDDHT